MELASSGRLQPADLVWRDGMANWVAAQTIKELFPQRAPAAVRRPAAAPAPDTYGLSPAQADPPAPVYRPTRGYEEPDDEEEPEPYPRRRRRQQSGANSVLMGIGITVAVVLAIGAVVLLVVLLKPGNPRTFNLSRNEKYTCDVEFKAGVRARVTVTSEFDSDVDLFIFDSAGREVVRDDGPSKDARVEWVPDRTQTYRIEVWNRILDPRMRQDHRNRSNRCPLQW